MGQWCISDEELELMATRFYKDLYARDTSTVFNADG